MSYLNAIDEPTPLQIQNELRLYANEIGGTIDVNEECGIRETTYTIGGTRVRLFEREDSAYLKINVPSEDDPDFDEIGNYDLDDIDSIEFNHDPHRLIVNCGNGDNYDWGL